MKQGVLYKVVDAGRSGFVSLLRGHLGDDFTDWDGAPSPFTDVVDFRAHLETTYDCMNSRRERDFGDCLVALSRHFAAALPNQFAFATCLQDSALLDALIENFDNVHFTSVSPLIAELFVNLSALDPRFATRFLRAHGYEKVVHVRDACNNRKPILLILAYNIFSQGGEDSIRECSDFQIYLSKMSRALKAGDCPILYFSSFVLVSLLRSAPLSVSKDGIELITGSIDFTSMNSHAAVRLRGSDCCPSKCRHWRQETESKSALDLSMVPSKTDDG
jgi:hypothetical protein